MNRSGSGGPFTSHRFPFERRAWEPLFYPDGDPPNPDPANPPAAKTFTQADIDRIVAKEKADVRDALKRDPEFISELKTTVKAELTAEATTEENRKKGEYQKMLDDALAMKQGAIPDDSPLGIAMKLLHGRANGYEATFKTITDKGLQELPEPVRALMPEGLAPDKQVEWIEKAKSVQVMAPTGATGASGPTGPAGPRKPTNGVTDPKPVGDVTIKVDDVIAEMKKLGFHQPL